MKFTFEDVKKIAYDMTPDGDFEGWLQALWAFIEHDRRNVCSTSYEIIGFYRLIYGLCKLYGGFVNVYCGGDEDYGFYLEIDYEPLLKYAEFSEDSEEDIKEYIRMLVEENDFSEAAALLSSLGTDKVFVSIYFAMGYEDFSFADSDDEVICDILNELDGDKMTAYSWLKNILG